MHCIHIVALTWLCALLECKISTWSHVLIVRRGADAECGVSFGGNIAELGGELCVVSNYSGASGPSHAVANDNKAGTAGLSAQSRGHQDYQLTGHGKWLRGAPELNKPAIVSKLPSRLHCDSEF